MDRDELLREVGRLEATVRSLEMDRNALRTQLSLARKSEETLRDLLAEELDEERHECECEDGCSSMQENCYNDEHNCWRCNSLKAYHKSFDRAAFGLGR